MGELAGVAFVASSVTEGWASNGGVGHPTRVSALSLLATVGVGALGPVMATRSAAPFDLVSVHAEFIRAVDCFINGTVILTLGKVKTIDELLLFEIVEIRIDTFQHFSRLMGNEQIIQNQMQLQKNNRIFYEML